MAPPAVVQLACKSCQAKKLKCDKGNPCSNCDRAGVACLSVTRSRLPRGRNGGRKSDSDDLRDRVKRLEALVRGQITAKSEMGLATSTAPAGVPLSPDVENVTYLGGGFWATLCNEVESLRDVLNEDVPEDDPDSTTPPPRGTQTNSILNFVLCSPSSFMLSPGALKKPPKAVTLRLCDLFLRDVDPIFKVFHAPSVRNLLCNGEHYLGLSPESAPIEALSYSIFYSAINALDEETCLREFAEVKEVLLQQFRFSLEVYLGRADFINTVDIPTLQALTLFLASQRTSDSSRASWTLFSLAVRIAQAMGLNHEPPPSVGIFEREIRRRLWHCIQLLDMQTSFDRGTDVIIKISSFTTHKPLNINDVDISPRTTVSPCEPEGFTDMTMASLAVEASTMCRIFTQHPTSDFDNTWEHRHELVLMFEKIIESRHISKCNHDVTFQSFVARIGTSMCITARLLSGRPMQRPLTTPPAHETYNYLKLSVEVIRQYNEVQADPSFKGWVWFLWLPWHALAVALAELCVQDQSPLMLQAWPVVQLAYDTFAENVADTSSGLLWKPIQKLMRKAQERFKREYRPLQPGLVQPSDQMRDVEETVRKYNPFVEPTTTFSRVENRNINVGPAMAPHTPSDQTVLIPPEDQAWQNWELFLDDMMTSNDFSVDASSYETWSGQTGMQI